jgi:hypothetical protein
MNLASFRNFHHLVRVFPKREARRLFVTALSLSVYRVASKMEARLCQGGPSLAKWVCFCGFDTCAGWCGQRYRFRLGTARHFPPSEALGSFDPDESGMRYVETSKDLPLDTVEEPSMHAEFREVINHRSVRSGVLPMRLRTTLFVITGVTPFRWRVRSLGLVVVGCAIFRS